MLLVLTNALAVMPFLSTAGLHFTSLCHAASFCGPFRGSLALLWLRTNSLTRLSRPCGPLRTSPASSHVTRPFFPHCIHPKISILLFGTPFLSTIRIGFNRPCGKEALPVFFFLSFHPVLHPRMNLSVNDMYISADFQTDRCLRVALHLLLCGLGALAMWGGGIGLLSWVRRLSPKKQCGGFRGCTPGSLTFESKVY